MIDKIMNTIQNKVLPIATKIGNQRFLVALRDSFIGTMPIVMTGSIALLINAFWLIFLISLIYKRLRRSSNGGWILITWFLKVAFR